MDEIKRKLRILDNIWRNYYWDYDFLLKEIKYDKELLTNYPGVVLGIWMILYRFLIAILNVHSTEDAF